MISILSLDRRLVNESARLSTGLMQSTYITPVEIKCLMVLCHHLKGHNLPLYRVFSVWSIANWLSQCMHRAETGFSHNGISSKKLESFWFLWCFV